MEQINKINLLRMTAGSPQYIIDVDPYWNSDDWNESARGDGHSYSGVEESVARLPGETDEEFVARAQIRASELSDEYGL